MVLDMHKQIVVLSTVATGSWALTEEKDAVFNVQRSSDVYFGDAGVLCYHSSAVAKDRRRILLRLEKHSLTPALGSLFNPENEAHLE